MSSKAIEITASPLARLGAALWLLPAVIFLFLMAGIALPREGQGIAERLLELASAESGTGLQPLHGWLWVGCLLLLMPLSSL